jgi:hypothetical protein
MSGAKGVLSSWNTTATMSFPKGKNQEKNQETGDYSKSK